MSAPSARRSAVLPWAAFAGCTLVWSSTFLVISIGNDSMAPVWAATVRLALGALVLSLLVVANGHAWPRGRALEAAIGFGIVDFGISLPLLYWGERAVPSSVAAILYATIPLTTALFARALGLERLNRMKVVAAIIGLAGVVLLFSAERHASLPAGPLAAVFMGAVTAAFAGVLLKRGDGGSALAINAVAHAAGIPLCVIASFALRESHALPATAGGIFSLAYLTIVGSVFAFVLFAWLVQRWDVTRTSFIAIVTPVLATVLGMVVRHERHGLPSLLGAAVVLAGVTLAIASDRRRARA